MERIQILDPHVVNQIAAGEVIERPASVVKELVENALDAGARRVEVRVEDGGRALVEVADDGWGLGAEDLGRAFLPHATSKVREVDDLLHISSLGFRGEALASVGSVARVRVTTRPEGSEAGWTLEDREGVLGEVEPAAASPGTVVRVEGLFQNVPARRKFLRTPATELGHISSLMGRFAVAYPDVAFRLTQGARTLLEAPAGQGRRERIASIHGDDVARRLLEVDGRAGDLELDGWVGPPALHRGDARLEQVFLNGRHVRDRTIAHALRQAYDGLLPPGGRRPVAFLFLRCDPARVDVNVHPAKAEVRWRDGSAVHRLVSRTLRARLEGAAPGVAVPVGTSPTPTDDTGGASSVPPSTAHAVEFAFTQAQGRAAGARPPASSPPVGESDRVADRAVDAVRRTAGEGLRPIGQLLGTYLVLEGEDEVVLVDQHALHERVLFERFSTRLRDAGSLEVQRLLVPTIVHLDRAEAALLAEETPLLESLGWHVESFGEDAVAIQGMPAVLRRPDPEGVLRDILDALAEGARDGLDRAALLGHTVDRMACRAAVMAGDVLHPDEVIALLEQAEALNHAHSCPHGRPTRLTLSRGQLERWFHRQV